MFQLSIIEMILFVLAAVVSLYYGYQGFRRIWQIINRGQGDFPPHDMGSRVGEALSDWALLKPTWDTRFVSSFFHAMVAWGFIFYFLVNLGDIVEGFFGVHFLGQGLVGNLFRLLADLLSVAVIVGMIYFLLRRFVFHSKDLEIRDNVKLMEKVRQGAVRRDSLIVGVFIILHVGFRFLGVSFGLAMEGMGDSWQPFASAASSLWSGFNDSTLTLLQHLSWWIALGLILAFIPYFPRSKHVHLIMSGFNFLTHPRRSSLGELEPMDFEDEEIEQFGAARLEQLPSTHILDAYACIMCNRCQDECPAYLTGKELSPSALEINKRYYINAHVNELAAGDDSEQLLTYAISDSALWACTACGACIEICPVGNEPMFDIMHIRRNQVLMESQFPHELQQAFRGMERSGNPWNLARGDRMAWASDLDIPTVEDNPEFDILWWVGCAPAYDMRAQKTARAFVAILKAAGVNFAVLGEMENCTGDSARRSGNEALFWELALSNIEVLDEFDVSRIVTTCPHCMHVLGKEYHQYGGQYDVIHSTQLIADLMLEGKIQSGPASSGPVTFHDPCYLGRQNDILDPPRQVLQGVSGDLVEMKRQGRQSFCCGAGGAQMWKEEEPGQKAVNESRYEEAAATGAKTIAVGCPFCLTMLTDASKQADQGIEVKDVVELVAEGLVDRG
ncbi:MAG: (Fe-S)-binding protein [Chloroflexota bacterium]|nr:(Fe-S)-binding protein [Chloroflexota bacterium]